MERLIKRFVGFFKKYVPGPLFPAGIGEHQAPLDPALATVRTLHTYSAPWTATHPGGHPVVIHREAHAHTPRSARRAAIRDFARSPRTA